MEDRLMKTAVVIAFHGSRRTPPDGPEIELVARQVRSLYPDLPVYYGALQFSAPSIADAVASAVTAGARRVAVVPLFLFSGEHVQVDIPAELDRLRERFPGVEITFGRHIGADPRLAQILVDRAKEVAAGLGVCV